jgi:hypothetical protein
MAKKVLHVPKGTDEVNHDGKLYRADNNGDVEVDAEAVGPLLKTGGCTIDDDSGDDPVGFVRVAHPGGTDSCSWGGRNYSARKDGSILVPAVAVVDLAAHGFVPIDTPESEVEADKSDAKAGGLKLKIPTK